MDRKELEKYLRMYPVVNKELERLQGDLDYYADEMKKYQSMTIPEQQKANMLQTIETACASCVKEIKTAMEARHKIDRLLKDISPLQKEIIKHRFWASKGRPDTWDMIGNRLCFHPVYLKRQYKKVMDKLISAF